jgi:hypothetical protein
MFSPQIPEVELSYDWGAAGFSYTGIIFVYSYIIHIPQYVL